MMFDHYVSETNDCVPDEGEDEGVIYANMLDNKE